MANTASVSTSLKLLARSIKDPVIQTAVLDIETKVVELDVRVKDIERRLIAGGL